MGYTLYYYWLWDDEERIEYLSPEQFDNILKVAKKFASKYDCQVNCTKDKARKVIVINGECESLLVYGSSKDMKENKDFLQFHEHDDQKYVFDFCKTQGYDYDPMIKTILIYMLSIGAIRSLGHDGGSRFEMAEDVDAEMFKALARKKYKPALGKAILNLCDFGSEDDLSDPE